VRAVLRRIRNPQTPAGICGDTPPPFTAGADKIEGRVGKFHTSSPAPSRRQPHGCWQFYQRPTAPCCRSGRQQLCLPTVRRIGTTTTQRCTDSIRRPAQEREPVDGHAEGDRVGVVGPQLRTVRTVQLARVLLYDWPQTCSPRLGQSRLPATVWIGQGHQRCNCRSSQRAAISAGSVYRARRFVGQARPSTSPTRSRAGDHFIIPDKTTADGRYGQTTPVRGDGSDTVARIRGRQEASNGKGVIFQATGATRCTRLVDVINRRGDVRRKMRPGRQPQASRPKVRRQGDSPPAQRWASGCHTCVDEGQPGPVAKATNDQPQGRAI